MTVCSLCLGTGKVFHETPSRKDTPWSRCHCASTDQSALQKAIGHIEHMAAWIANQNAGYSFESLGEDFPEIKAAVCKLLPAGRTES